MKKVDPNPKKQEEQVLTQIPKTTLACWLLNLIGQRVKSGHLISPLKKNALNPQQELIKQPKQHVGQDFGQERPQQVMRSEGKFPEIRHENLSQDDVSQDLQKINQLIQGIRNYEYLGLAIDLICSEYYKQINPSNFSFEDKSIYVAAPYIYLKRSQLAQDTITQVQARITHILDNLAGKITQFAKNKSIQKIKALMKKGVNNIRYISLPDKKFQLRGFVHKDRIYINTYYLSIQFDIKLKQNMKICVAYCVLTFIRLIATYVLTEPHSLNKKLDSVLEQIYYGQDQGYKFEISLAKKGFECASEKDYQLLKSSKVQLSKLGKQTNQKCIRFQRHKTPLLNMFIPRNAREKDDKKRLIGTSPNLGKQEKLNRPREQSADISWVWATRKLKSDDMKIIKQQENLINNPFEESPYDDQTQKNLFFNLMGSLPEFSMIPAQHNPPQAEGQSEEEPEKSNENLSKE